LGNHKFALLLWPDAVVVLFFLFGAGLGRFRSGFGPLFFYCLFFWFRRLFLVTAKLGWRKAGFPG
jgi:hypothetical protein